MEDQREAILDRLRRIEGQIRGLQRMIEEHRDCEEIITQIAAARAALDKVASLILRQHLADCVLQADPAKRERNLQKALDLLFRLKP